MSVSVDYDGDDGVDVIYSVWGSGPWLEDVRGAVASRAGDVHSYLVSLEQAAEYAASVAVGAIDSLKEFNVDLTSITYEIPTYESVTLTYPDAQVAPAPNTPAAPASLSADIQSSTPVGPIDPTFSAPDPVPTPVVPAPPTLEPGFELPNGPSDYALPSLSVPELGTTAFAPSIIEAPLLDNVRYTVPDFIDLEALAVEYDLSDLDAAVERLENVDTTPVDVPAYLNILPEVFEATGGLVNGIPNFSIESLRRNLSDIRDDRQSAAHAFARRDLDVFDAFTDWVTQSFNLRISVSDAVAEARIQERLILDGYKVASAALQMQSDIELKLYALLFAANKASALANLELAKATTSIYNANILRVRTMAADYNAQAAQLKAEATAFVESTKGARLTGDLNRQLAELFSLDERVKGTDADLFRARVEAEGAKLTAYRAVISSYAANTAAAEAAVAAYTAESQRYAGEVERVQTNYDVAATRARAVEIENRAKVEAIGASGTELRAAALAAQNSAARASTAAAVIAAKAAKRELPFVAGDYANARAGYLFSGNAANYATTVANYVADTQSKGTAFSGTGKQARSLSSYMDKASRAAGRAASLAATTNEQLARVYAQLYEAAGRAGAAVESGKLSGFRASTTMSASDALGSSISKSVGVGSSGTNSYSEQFSRNKQISA